MKLNIAKVLVGSLLIISSNTFASTILTFNNPPVIFQDGYGPGDQYVEGDYMLSNAVDPGGHGSVIRFNPFNQNALVPNNGTVHVGTTLFSNPWLQRTDGGAFSLLSLDIAEYSEHVTWITSVSLTGHMQNGETVQATLALDGVFDGIGGVEDFQKYVLNWDKLVRLDFNTDGIAFDNIEVSAVPIPTAVWLFASGLFMLLSFNRTFSNIFRKA